MANAHGDIDTMESLAFWLHECDGRYTLGLFCDGIGLLGTHGGGCWGILTTELVEKMKSEGYLEEGRAHQAVTAKFWEFAKRHQYARLKRELEPLT